MCPPGGIATELDGTKCGGNLQRKLSGSVTAQRAGPGLDSHLRSAHQPFVHITFPLHQMPSWPRQLAKTCGAAKRALRPAPT